MSQKAIRLALSVDEAINLHAQIESMQRDLADFYAVAADSMNVKPATFKKLVRYIRVGEDAADPALKDLLTLLEGPQK